jgi:hypothetical protein
MAALGLTFAAFVFVLLLGLGCTVALRRSPLTIPDILLAPATGLAILMAIIIPLNRGGLGVDRFAFVTLVVLGTVTFLIVWGGWRWIVPALCRAAALFAIAVVGALITAYPMMSYGSDWFSYANDDGVNYALSAERLRMGGLYDVPPIADYGSDRDVRFDYYFLNGVPSERYGADELLAFESALTRQDAVRVLMPVMVTLYLALVLATAALAYRGRYEYYNALACAIGLVLCALFTFAVLDQLLAQAVGLIFLSAAVARACAPEVIEARGGSRIATYGLTILAFSGLFFGYPELGGFALLATAAYYFSQRPIFTSVKVKFFAIVAAGTIVVLNLYVRNVLFVTTERLSGSQVKSANQVFPYFLVPTGVANFFGVIPIASFPAEPRTSLSILVGLIFLSVALGSTIWGVRRRLPAAYLSALFFCAAAISFWYQSGFALFKLAMYAQPAIIALLATAAVAALASKAMAFRAIAAAAAAAFLVVNAFSLQNYIQASGAALRSANFVEVPDISGDRLFDQLDLIRRKLTAHEVVVCDTFNLVLAKIEGFYGRGSGGMSFPSSAGQALMSYAARASRGPFFDHSRDAILASLARERATRYSNESFALGSGVHDDSFVVDHLVSGGANSIWVTGSQESPFNRLRLAGVHGVQSAPGNTNNVLSFVNSSLGRSYFAHTDPIGVYPLEPDFFSKRKTMSAIGRYLLFEVINPKPPIRIRLSLTTTFFDDGKNQLPPAVAIGVRRVPFQLIGRGSADVISGPIFPRVIDGRSFVLIDMGQQPIRFVYSPKGLMALWGRDVHIDPRALTGFLRDLSVIAERARPPARLAKFPEDLLTSVAQYSGIYEDGWASEDFSVTLAVGPSGMIQLVGQLPLVDDPSFSTRATVFVDGFPTVTQDLGVGDVRVPVMSGAGVHRFEWRFSKYQRLPGTDHRRATILIHSIG